MELDKYLSKAAEYMVEVLPEIPLRIAEGQLRGRFSKEKMNPDGPLDEERLRAHIKKHPNPKYLVNQILGNISGVSYENEDIDECFKKIRIKFREIV